MCHLVIARQLADRLSRVVHEGHRLRQEHALVAEASPADRCAILQLVHIDGPLARQRVYELKAYLRACQASFVDLPHMSTR